MCGRFTQKSDRRIISLEFYVQDFRSDVFINYNVSPGQSAGVIIYDSDFCYDQYRWGLVPYWAKDPTIGNRMINARAETVTEKPSFRKAFERRRCLIPADGFFEWKKEDGRKTPYYIFTSSGKPMSLAGLWEIWSPPEKRQRARGTTLEKYHYAGSTEVDRSGGSEGSGPYESVKSSSKYPPEEKPLHTFTIITTSANEKLQQLHERMPVIIPPEKRELWLKPEEKNLDHLLDLLKPLPAEGLDFYEVSRLVNSPQNNSSECIQPLMG